MLWLLFLYIEAAVRLRDLRHMPFHLDLCRPFAAHWYFFSTFCKNIYSRDVVLHVSISIQFINDLFKLNLSIIFSIGYPVVTLGFGFKSYVGFRMRQVSFSYQY